MVAISRGGMVEAQQHIRAIAYGVAAGGILLAIVFSLWIAARVSRPIEQLARAAEEVAGGNWDARVPVRGRDEVSVLARSFNHMTEQLAEPARTAGAERARGGVARTGAAAGARIEESAFPLQLTVENLVRARELPEAEFDEVFRESTADAGHGDCESEDDHRAVQRLQQDAKAGAGADRCRRMWWSACGRSMKLAANERTRRSRLKTDVADEPMPLMVDPELLHRALSNLVLNAMDAMPEGATLTISAHATRASSRVSRGGYGRGMTPEECERLFTPYYTTKQHGPGWDWRLCSRWWRTMRAR